MNEIQFTAKGKWPKANPDTVQALLFSIIRSYMDMVGRNEFERLLIVNDPNRKCPRTLYERINGSIPVLLAVKRGTLWSKIAYQLSHELNHVHANFNKQRNHCFKWLEESFCELSSLNTMVRMSEEWTTHPPNSPLKNYLSTHINGKDAWSAGRINQGKEIEQETLIRG